LGGDINRGMAEIERDCLTQCALDGCPEIFGFAVVVVFDTPIFAQPEATPGAEAKDPRLLRELREKLAKILAMIGSSQPGEVANAVRLAEAIRKNMGCSGRIFVATGAHRAGLSGEADA
jgi:hypothetical protein